MTIDEKPKTAMAMSDAAAAGSQAAAGFVLATWAEQDELLRTMWLAGEAPPVIADRLGRSVAAIMTRAARLGLPRRFAPGRKPTGRRNFLPMQKSALARAPHEPGAKTLPGEALTRPLTERICLMCLTKFPSQGPHNRICQSCKESNDYQAGARLPDLDFPT